MEMVGVISEAEWPYHMPSNSEDDITVWPHLPQPITAKTVVFHILSDHDSNLSALRSIEFFNNGTLIPLTTLDFSAYANRELNSTSYAAKNAFDTTLSKTGAAAGTSWFTTNPSNPPQKILIVFNTSQTFDKIVINNAHSSGNNSEQGCRMIRMVATDDTYTDTSRDSLPANKVEIGVYELAEHVPFDIVDDQVVWEV